jgi:hypothetical protein
VDGQTKPAEDSLIGETIANGYTFQGALIRPVLVRLRNGNGEAPSLPEATDETAAKPVPQPDELPLS